MMAIGDRRKMKANTLSINVKSIAIAFFFLLFLWLFPPLSKFPKEIDWVFLIDLFFIGLFLIGLFLFYIHRFYRFFWVITALKIRSALRGLVLSPGHTAKTCSKAGPHCEDSF